MARRSAHVLRGRSCRSSCTFRSCTFQAKYDFDLGPIMSLALGLATMGMMFVAIGLFLSSLTQESDHRGDLDVRRLAGTDRHFCARLCSSRHSSITRGRKGCDSWPFLYQIQSFGQGLLDFRFLAVHLSVCVFHAQPDGEGARNAVQPVTLDIRPSEARHLDEIRIAELYYRGKNSGWRPRPLAVGLVVAWILRGAPPGQSSTAEDDAQAPRSGYRDRMIAAVS